MGESQLCSLRPVRPVRRPPGLPLPRADFSGLPPRRARAVRLVRTMLPGRVAVRAWPDLRPFLARGFGSPSADLSVMVYLVYVLMYLLPC